MKTKSPSSSVATAGVLVSPERIEPPKVTLPALALWNKPEREVISLWNSTGPEPAPMLMAAPVPFPNGFVAPRTPVKITLPVEEPVMARLTLPSTGPSMVRSPAV